MTPLTDTPVAQRLDDMPVKLCRPLPTAKAGISFALSRFHESWQSYRTITPTLYGLREADRGVYLTLGHLRKREGLNQKTLAALIEGLEYQYQIDGYLLACEGVAGETPQLLFGLQGHFLGERQYGALELATLRPYESTFVTEFDVSPEDWSDLRLQAQTNTGIVGYGG
jgi:hypothetical protein